jgi:DHA1 family bicyclomycin/chloramphenicol resistance-like MFS transporter
MKQTLLPAIWLIVLIVGLPQLSETVYSPALPDIAHALQTSESLAEYTLTIYLFGFAIGTLFWGKISDSVGRKPCILAGMLIFVFGCIGCYLSDSITALMVSRFIQAFGGSIGSVLGQAICRDVFQGSALGKAYSTTGSALAFFPAIGPVIGGLISENFGWPSIFLFLIAFAMVLGIITVFRLPETHYAEKRRPISIKEVACAFFQDKKAIGFGIIVGACNGISFSYFAEGSFYLITYLGLSPSQYGFSFIAIAVSIMLGGLTSKRLHNHQTSRTIMGYGLWIILLASVVFSSIVLCHLRIAPMPQSVLIVTTIMSQMSIMYGICIATSNALALALVDYKSCIGTASSLFGFFYYCLVSLLTLLMGVLHNGGMLSMPLYFLTISVLMLLVQKLMIRKDC